MTKEKEKGQVELSSDDVDEKVDTAQQGLMALSELASAKLTKEVAIQVWDVVQLAKKSIETVRETTRQNIITFIQKNGSKAAEGGYFFRRGSKMVEMGGGGKSPNVSGSLLAALLSAKGKTEKNGKLEFYMDKTVTTSWSVNQEKLNKAISKGVITPEEVEECKNTVPFSVQQVKEIEDE